MHHPTVNRRWALRGLAALGALAGWPLRAAPPSATAARAAPATPSTATAAEAMALAAPAEAPVLPDALARLIADAGLPLDALGLHVQAIGRDAPPLVSLNPDRLFLLASTAKIVTTLAALDVLGPAYRWTTRAELLGPLVDGRLNGDLLIIGGGNPSLGSDELRQWFGQMRTRGLQEVSGDIVLDRRAFQVSEREHGSAPLPSADNPHHVRPDALLIDEGRVSVTLQPALQNKVSTVPPLQGVNVQPLLTTAGRGCNLDAAWLPPSASEPAARLVLNGRWPANCGNFEANVAPPFNDVVLAPAVTALWHEAGLGLGGQVRSLLPVAVAAAPPQRPSRLRARAVARQSAPPPSAPPPSAPPPADVLEWNLPQGKMVVRDPVAAGIVAREAAAAKARPMRAAPGAAMPDAAPMRAALPARTRNFDGGALVNVSSASGRAGSYAAASASAPGTPTPGALAPAVGSAAASAPAPALAAYAPSNATATAAPPPPARAGARGKGGKPKPKPSWMVHQSPPLAQLVRHINKTSDNVEARHLLLSMAPGFPARPATLPAARARVEQWLQLQGLGAGAVAMDNGAGLSRSERGTPRALVQLLQQATGSRHAALFMASLPIAGVDGTLANRMVGGPAAGRAYLKTGTLADTRNLAGYVKGRQATYAVALFVNHPEARGAVPMLDAIVGWIAANG